MKTPDIDSRANFYQNDFAEYCIEEGILVESMKPHIKVITLDIAVKTVSDRKKIQGGKVFPVYLDLNNVVYFNGDARDYTSLHDTYDNILAVAILAKNYMQYVGTIFFLTLFPPILPTRVFKLKNEAFEWLSEFK